ncbi:hypothetical protein [Sulfodiicoccus acidiphilus]|nr:hypothetical protein [Sulfodiicoccus acidiphilus]
MVEKLVVPTVKVACGFKVEDNELIALVGFAMAPTSREVLTKVSFWLFKINGSVLKCGICDRGPLTRKGLFLHLTRVHREEVKALVRDELTRELKKVAHAGKADLL